MQASRTSFHWVTGLLAVLSLVACGGDDADEANPPDRGAEAPAYASLPQPITAFGARVLGDSLYVHGGHIGEAHDTSIEALVPDLRRLDLSTPGAAWEEVAGPDLPIQQSALFTYEDKLYRLGGMTSKAHRGEDLDIYTLGDFAVYDGQADAWSALPAMPDTRSSHDVEIAGSTIYVTGGWKTAGGKDTEAYYSTWLSIDMSAPTPTWVEHEQPFQIRDHCGGVVDGKIYVLGGMLSGVFPTKAQVYDPATDAWSEGPELPTQSPIAGFGCAAATVGNTVYFSAAEGVIYKLNDARDGWDEVAKLETPRLFHRLVSHGDGELIALGGGTGQEVTGITSVESIQLK